MSGKRYPSNAGIGKTLTQFGNKLNDVEYDDIQTEWTQIQLGDNFVGISLDDVEYLRDNVDRIERNVIFVFDVAITAISIYRDFLFFLPNFMNAVITYIAGILYNALDSLLRLGIYGLVVSPDLSEIGENGLPTTNLKEQADNAYKKFYDYADPNIPYYLPFKKGLAEDIIDSGEKVKNKIKFYMEDSVFADDDTKILGVSLNPSGQMPPYMERDFTSFKDAVQNLQRPGGRYDALYLYFGVDFGSGTATALNFIEAVAKISDLFKFPTIEGLLKEYDSLFQPKRKRIKVLTDEKISFPITRSIVSNAVANLRKVDIETNKQVYKDPLLKEFRIFESNPIDSMTPERKEKIQNLFQEQIDVNTEKIESIGEEQYNEVLDYRLNNNTEYQELLKDIDILEDEIKYYALKMHIVEVLNITSHPEDYEILFDNFNPNFYFKELNNPNNYGNAVTFLDEYTNFRRAYNIYYNSLELSEGDINASLVDLIDATKRVIAAGEKIRNETVFSILPPQTSQENRAQKYLDKVEEKRKIEYNIKQNITTYIKGIQKAISEKNEQLDAINGFKGNTTDDLSDLSKTGEITFLHNYYPNAGRASLYKSYLEKFYNFSSAADADYVYELTIEIDAEANNFKTKLDKFNGGQYVQIREKVNDVWVYRGSGIIIEEVEQVFEDAGQGTWMKANFSDMIGLTADIKRLQNEVMGFQNLFEPNTKYFDDIINWLKDIKKRILEVISILDNLIDMIEKLLSIQLLGTVWAKYVRDDDYDKMALGITDVSGLTIPVKKADFDPLKVSTIQYYLNKIRKISPQEADRIEEDLTILVSKTDDSDDADRKKTISDKSIVSEVYPERVAFDKIAEDTKNAIENEILNRARGIVGLFNMGVASTTEVADVGIVPTEQANTTYADNSIALYEAKIYNEIHERESKLTKEFGFSLVLLSYLPVGLGFYPIRFIAEKLGLIDQSLSLNGNKLESNQNGLIPPFDLDSLDEQKIISLMPDYELSDLQKMLVNKSKNQNPARWFLPQPVPISVDLNPLVSTESFEFNIDDVNILQNDSSFLSVSGNSIKILRSMMQYYIAGAYLSPKNSNGFILDNGILPSSGYYKYRYEFTLNNGLNSLTCTREFDIDKIQIHFGIFQSGVTNITRKAFNLNDENNQIFTFGRLTEKKFIGDLYIGNRNQNIKPYILIGYDGDVSIEECNFQLINSQIFLYRVA